MPPVITALLYAAAPTVAIPAAAIAVSRFSPGPLLRSVLQHFAAGGLLAVVAVELLGDMDERNPFPMAIGIALGAAFMTGLDVASRRIERRGGALASAGFLATATVDFLIDGLLLGVALAQNPRLGIVLAIALTLEDLVTGLSVASTVAEDLGPGRLLITVSLIGLALPVGAIVGALIGGAVAGAAYTVVLAFAAVAILFLVIEELLREAHEVAETAWATVMLFSGLLVFLLIEATI